MMEFLRKYLLAFSRSLFLQEVSSSEKAPPSEEFQIPEHLFPEEIKDMEGVSVLRESDT